MTSMMQGSEINTIIHALDSKTSIFKTCEIFKENTTEARLLDPEYKIRESASLTDLIQTSIQMYDGSTPSAFLKIWFDWASLPYSTKVNGTRTLYTIFSGGTSMFGRAVESAFSVNGRMMDFKNANKRILEESTSSSLNYEEKMYKFINEHIIIPDVSPNFIPLLMSHVCDINTVLASITPNPKTEILASKLSLFNTFYPGLTLKFMMTGSAPGIEQFYTFVNSGPVLSDTDVNAIFFQFLYAFYIMNYFMIQHNDNHFGNVLIQTLPEYVNMDITVGGRNINFKTKHVIKFFDWDRSYTPSIGPNSILNAHVDNGTYNSFVPNRDFSTFLCFLKKYKIFEGIMSEMIPATAYISQNTRKHEEFIGNISESLHEWIKENKHIIHTDYKGKTFILVPRDVIERTFSKSSKQLLYSALGFASTLPDSISGVFLQFEFVDNDIYLPKGFSCHPLVSSSDVDIVKFFEDEETFKKLCKGLDKGISPTVYSYNFQKSV